MSFQTEFTAAESSYGADVATLTTATGNVEAIAAKVAADRAAQSAGSPMARQILLAGSSSGAPLIAAVRALTDRLLVAVATIRSNT